MQQNDIDRLLEHCTIMLDQGKLDKADTLKIQDIHGQLLREFSINDGRRQRAISRNLNRTLGQPLKNREGYLVHDPNQNEY